MNTSTSTPIDDSFDIHTLPGSAYGYSGAAIEALADGATEYTLVTLVVDGSGSTTTFRTELQKAVSTVVLGCQRCPTADSLLLRVVEFDDTLREVHPFKMLSQANPADYERFMTKSGWTALYDASENAIAATVDYATKLRAQKYKTNGIVVILTDGEESGDSKLPVSAVQKRVNEAMATENLESIVLILLGLNPGKSSHIEKCLSDFAAAADFRYLNISELTPAKFAEIAEFIIASISSQSQSLGTGGPSKPIDASALLI